MLGLYTAPPSTGGALLLDCSPFVQSCDFSTNDHGFEALTAPVLRALAGAFRLFDYPLMYLGLFWDGQIVWEGRLEDPTLYTGGDGSGFTAQALGAWRALSDTKYIALWSKTTVTDFRPVLTSEIATAFPDRFSYNYQNQIQIMPLKGAIIGSTGAGKQAYVVFQAPNSGGRTIIGAQFSAELTFPAANWRGALIAQNTNLSTNSIPWLLATAGAGTLLRAVHVTFTGVPAVSFFVDFNAADAAFAGENGSAYLKITNLRLVTATTNRVNTTLTVNRAAGVNVTATVGSTARMYVGMQLVINSANNPSEVVTVLSIGSATQFNATFVGNYVIGNAVQGFIIYADEITADVVARANATNPAQLSSGTTLIQSPGLDLLDENYIDANLGDILTRLASLGDNQTPPRMWEVGVYEDRQLYLRPQGGGRAWYVDATDLSVARTLEQLYNFVNAIYQDTGGRRLITAVASDATSVTRYGIQRLTIIGTNTTSATQAGVERDAYLQDHKDPLPRAAITFEAVYDASGGRYPLWLVRAGDTITIRNLPPSLSTSVDRIRTFRITHTSYDVFGAALTVEPELPPTSLEFMLARKAEGV